jgi:uncharacterized membrane protein YkvI
VDLRRIHAGAAWLFVASIVVQVFLIGAAMRELGGSSNFSDHINFGYAIGLLALAVVVTAVIARAGRNAIATSLGLLVLYVVQTVLPAFSGSMPWVSALHPVNALVLFAIAIWYARRAWRMSSPATA